MWIEPSSFRWKSNTVINTILYSLSPECNRIAYANSKGLCVCKFVRVCVCVTHLGLDATETEHGRVLVVGDGDTGQVHLQLHPLPLLPPLLQQLLLLPAGTRRPTGASVRDPLGSCHFKGCISWFHVDHREGTFLQTIFQIYTCFNLTTPLNNLNLCHSANSFKCVSLIDTSYPLGTPGNPLRSLTVSDRRSPPPSTPPVASPSPRSPPRPPSPWRSPPPPPPRPP